MTAQIPVNGAANWGDDLREYLLVSHDTAGRQRNVFNVKDYGATGLGVVDDTAGIVAANAAAALVGGTVFAPAGTYKIASAITFGAGVALQGQGGATSSGQVTIFKCTAAGARIAFGGLGAAILGPPVSGFCVDGNAVATNPLYIGCNVNRIFMDVGVTNAAAGSAGLLIQQAQNCTFVSLDVSTCAGNGITLDRGTGGHVFIRTEIQLCGDYGLRFRQSTGAAEGGTFFDAPSYNVFYGGDFEGAHGQVLHEAGICNTIREVAITDAPVAAQVIVKMTQSGALGSNYFRLENLVIQGALAYSTGIQCGSGTAVYLGDGLNLQVLLNGIELQAGCGSPQGWLDPALVQNVTNKWTGAFASFLTTSETLGSVRAYNGLGTNHTALATPTFGVTGDVKVGNGKVWINDAATWKQLVADFLTAITYSATMATDAATGTLFKIIATNGTAFTLSTPTNPSTGQTITYDIKNSSGGAMGVVTWGGAFLLAGAFVNPANTKRRTISFYYDGTNWVETNRAAADI